MLVFEKSKPATKWHIIKVKKFPKNMLNTETDVVFPNILMSFKEI